MPLTKYAELQVLEVERETAMSRTATLAGLQRKPVYETISTAAGKTAHRATFDYVRRPGYIYVRSRAISSRTNDNYDEFPAAEIKKAYRTFLGKPVFVNHHNDDHRRARGVIIDAALHEDTNPDGTPDTWTEVLMEVDAARFPRLAEEIVNGNIARTSMGTNVEYSICTACGNKAFSPVEYCQHIPRMKGLKIRRWNAAGGAQEEVLIAERCYGLGFFENSLLVEDPADPTAYVLGVEGGLETTATRFGDAVFNGGEHLLDKADRGMDKVDDWADKAMGPTFDKIYEHLPSTKRRRQEEQDRTNHYFDMLQRNLSEQMDEDDEEFGIGQHRHSGVEGHWDPHGQHQHKKCRFPVYGPRALTTCGLSLGPGDFCPEHGPQAQDLQMAAADREAFRYNTDHQPYKHEYPGTKPHVTEEAIPAGSSITYMHNEHGKGYGEGGAEHMQQSQDKADADVERQHRRLWKQHHPGQPFQGHRHTAVGEVKAPAQVDTMRAERCPVCQDDDAYDGERCGICGYVAPPEMFQDPDLDKARQVDLRQDQLAQPDEEGNLQVATDDVESGRVLQCDTCGEEFGPDAEAVSPTDDPAAVPQGAAAPAAAPADPAADPQAADPSAVPSADDQVAAGPDPAQPHGTPDPDDLSDLADKTDQELGLDAEPDPNQPNQPDQQPNQPEQQQQPEQQPDPQDPATDPVVDPAVDQVDPADAEAEAPEIPQVADDGTLTDQDSVVKGDLCPICGQGTIVSAPAGSPDPADPQQDPKDTDQTAEDDKASPTPNPRRGNRMSAVAGASSAERLPLWNAQEGLRGGLRADTAGHGGRSRLGAGMQAQALHRAHSSGSGDSGRELAETEGHQRSAGRMRQGASVHRGEHLAEEERTAGLSPLSGDVSQEALRREGSVTSPGGSRRMTSREQKMPEQDPKKTPPVNPAKATRNRLVQALMGQQRQIAAQRTEITSLRETVLEIGAAAGLSQHPRFVALRRQADDTNQTPETAPATTSDDARTPDATDTPSDVGATGEGANVNVTPQAVTDVSSTDKVEPGQPPLSNLVDVTSAPPASVTSAPPAGDGDKVINPVTIGTPSTTVMDPPGSTGWNTSSAKEDPMERHTASLRYARLRLAAGLDQGEDLALAERIAASKVTLETIKAQAALLSESLSAQQATAPTRAQAQRLVPRSAQGGRAPSLGGAATDHLSAVASTEGLDEWAIGLDSLG